MGQESGFALAGLLLQSLSEGCNQGVGQSWRSTGEVPLPSSGGCWQHIPLEDCWTESLSSLLAVSQRPPSLHAMWACPHGSLLQSQQGGSQYREPASRMGVTVLCNVTMQVRSPHLCHILLVRNKSQVRPKLKGRGLNYRR